MNHINCNSLIGTLIVGTFMKKKNTREYELKGSKLIMYRHNKEKGV